MKKFLLNALTTSLLVMIFGLVITYIIMYITNKEAIYNFEHWTSVSVSFFLTGLIVFSLNEYFGLTEMYIEKKRTFEIYL